MTLKVNAMTKFSVGVWMGSFVIVFAAISVAGHYLREHRRHQLFKNLGKGYTPELMPHQIE
jgi:hypothetical protein